MKRILVDVNEELHREFKTYCYSIGKTIKQVLAELMVKEIKEKGGRKTKKKK